ncbi:hypothetical protein F2P79_018116 [Pimephales promelas]|nr:hypothetical protein F2P79_018116 [Pimephales promelas]
MDYSGVARGVDVENSFGQKIWQNVPSVVHLDLLSSKGSPQLPQMLLSPVFQDSHPEPLFTLLSLNRNSLGSTAGAPQMCFTPSLEDNGQDVDSSHNPSPLRHGTTRDCQVDTKSLSSEQVPHFFNASNQTWVDSVEEIEEGLMIQSLWHVSQHVSLVDRAGRLQQRVLAMLGEHASRHYSHQLEGLKSKRLEKRCSPKYPMTSEHIFESFNAVEMQEEYHALGRNLQHPQAHGQPLKSKDVENLVHSGHTVLHRVMESLDSDATVSSSDEEWEHEDTRGTSVDSHCRVCEWRWLKDRAELCSRWTWLQMRLSELDSQIQWLGKLQQQILSNKGHVVLAESQPLTDRQIQHTLWTETMDLSFTAGNMRDLHSDPEMEPSSPTRLLRNIERQSAQLTQIVNSLMPSLCASPSSSPTSKGPCNRWRGQENTTYSRSCSLPLLFFPIAPLVILPLCAQTLSAEKREQAAKCIMFYHCPQISSITLKSDLISQSDDSLVEESFEDVTVSYCSPKQQRNSQFPLRRRNCESVFSIDDIVVPMSLFNSVKVERLQYKNILTPSWRKVDISPLLEREDDDQEEELEEIEDEDFIQRHQSYEHREKLWSYWDQDGRNQIRSVCIILDKVHICC